MKNPLSLVDNGPDGAIGAEPPRKLAPAGRALWNRIMSEYRVEDAGGIEILTLAAEATDRIQSLTEAIDRDGVVLHTRGTVKSHPSLRDELQTRAFVAKCLERLGVNLEVVKSVGRPSSGIGWRG